MKFSIKDFFSNMTNSAGNLHFQIFEKCFSFPEPLYILSSKDFQT